MSWRVQDTGSTSWPKNGQDLINRGAHKVLPTDEDSRTSPQSWLRSHRYRSKEQYREWFDELSPAVQNKMIKPGERHGAPLFVHEDN